MPDYTAVSSLCNSCPLSSCPCNQDPLYGQDGDVSSWLVVPSHKGPKVLRQQPYSFPSWTHFPLGTKIFKPAEPRVVGEGSTNFPKWIMGVMVSKPFVLTPLFLDSCVLPTGLLFYSGHCILEDGTLSSPGITSKVMLQLYLHQPVQSLCQAGNFWVM